MGPLPALNDVAIDQVLAKDESKAGSGSDNKVHDPLSATITANVTDSRLADGSNLEFSAVSRCPSHGFETAAPVTSVEPDLLLGSIRIVLDLNVSGGRTFHRMSEVISDNVVAVTPAAADIADAIAPGVEKVSTQVAARLRLCEA